MQRLLLSCLTLLVATGTSATAGDLQLTAVHPTWGVESLPTEIEVEGMNFMEGTEVALVGGGAYFVSSTVTNSFRDVAVVDNRAYAIGGLLTIFDVSDPWAPRQMSSLPNLSGWSIVVSGDHAYVSGNRALTIVNVSDPSNPRTVGNTTSCSGGWFDVAVAGTLAAIACGSEGGVLFFDVADPTEPQLIGTLESPGGREGENFAVAIRDDVAFVNDRSVGLAAVDITDPTAPFILSTPDQGTFWSRDLEMAGDYAYVTGEHLGVQVFDIRDPRNITLVGQAKPSRNSYAIGASEGFAFVGDSAAAGLHVYDIREPHRPIGSYVVYPSNPVAMGLNIEVAHGFAYATSPLSSSLDIYDVRATELPGISAQIETLDSAHDLAVENGRVYVASGYGGLQVYDVSEPSQPVFLGVMEDAEASRVILRGGLAYVSDFYFGLHIIDVSDPVSPRIVGSLELPDHVYEIGVNEPFVYVSHYLYDELFVVDSSDASEPALVTTLAMEDEIAQLAIAGDLLYVANSWEGLVVMDISEPSRPIPIGRLRTPGQAMGVAVSGDLAFIADGPGGFHVVDISNPLSPQVIGTLQNGIEATGLVLAGTTAFIQAQVGGYHDFKGMLMIDVSEPTVPRLVGGSDHLLSRMVVSGDFVYMARYSKGLQVLHIPPVQTGYIDGSERMLIGIPSGMNVGTYNVLGLNPNGRFDILRNAFTILPDGDGDGVPTDEDCDDQNASIHPGAADLPGNTVDENCDGLLACDPAAAWQNRGEFVSCVAQECAVLRKAGLVTGQECGVLISAAKRSAVR